MARRYNSLYIGSNFLTEEGRDIKHVGLIREFGNPNINKTADKPLKFKGIDLETNSKTAELRLFGTWDGNKYQKHTKNFMAVIFNLIYHAFWDKDETALVWWSKLDPFIIYKQFLLLYALEPEKQKQSLLRYGKIGGVWDRKQGKWKIKPVIEIEIKRGHKTFRFGIKNVIRSSINFYFYEVIGNMPKQLDNETYPLSQVWAFDVNPLYKYHLAKEMDARKDLFPYYSKVSEDAHLVDWERYETDADYRVNVVDRSNRYDARAVYDLAVLTCNNFHTAHGYHLRNLISAGSIARAAIVATIKNKYINEFGDTKEAANYLKNDIKAISLESYFDIWASVMPHDRLKDMFCLFYESYSGGYIEAFRYGLIKNGYFSDLASAYIKHISELYDLRDSTPTYGEGEPPHTDNSYCFIRGTITIPEGVNYIPITVKHIEHKSTNVRATGSYIGSYTLPERDFMVKQGATFKDETWYNIETTGEQSPIGFVAEDLTRLRYKLIEAMNSAEYLVKTETASLYGIMFEATNTYIENDSLDIVKDGYRGGEFLNPLYASYITANTRIQVAEANLLIEQNGGKPVLTMTDAVFVEGDTDTMPEHLIKHKKTLGWFETPVKFKQMACLGTGRYSYIDEKKGYVTTKNRGLNIKDIHSESGVDVGVYNWIEALKEAEKANSTEIVVKVRTLISVGVVATTNKMKSLDSNGKEIEIPISVSDLGLVMDTYRKVDIVTGGTKRIIHEIKDLKDITRGSVGTDSIHYGRYMQVGNEYIDQSLSTLRNEVMKKDVKTAKITDLANRSKASMKYAKKHKDDILKTERDKYQMIKDLGYKREIAKKWCKRSYERIQNELLGGN